jgi:hypothetical protein
VVRGRDGGLHVNSASPYSSSKRNFTSADMTTMSGVQ